MTVDSAPERVGAGEAHGRALRPDALGTRHAVAAGHPLAALAASRILEAGGNAVDAGVAGGICLGVVHSDIVNFAGVAPIMIYDAARREVATISGLGPWPRRASIEFFRRACRGEIPEGILRTVVPGAPDAWITALERFGTLGFAEVAAPAIELARDGFPMGAFVAAIIRQNEARYRRWPTSAPIYLPNGRPPAPGQRFVQADLGRTLTYMADEDRAARRRGRTAGLQAARDAFYRGDIAAAIVRYHEQEGGLLGREDLAEFRVGVEPPLHTTYREYEVFGCGFWCQGPVLLQMLNILGPLDLRALGHNSAPYIHVVIETMKLAFADREAYYGDPRHVKVPDRLLDLTYAAARRGLIDEARAWPEMPPPGDPVAGQAVAPAWTPPVDPRSSGRPALDTSYIAVVDRAGNAFSATPSDVSTDTPIIPGTGLAVSSRGSQSWLLPEHPSAVAPGKRPRLTPNPAMVVRDGRLVMPFGTPGGDVQCQAMLQVLLNLLVFGMSPQGAVEAPRFATQSFPDSFWPHRYFPGRLMLEGRIPDATASALADRGHRVERWSDWEWRAGGVCLARVDETGVRWGAADPRRDSYAIAW
ncbi:MAG: gamma-glutamyltransferase family protein [Candidatus Rokubacteria bacterium]|nr:gamma-glutamyltransferase family protein [Candidatus Rokubacteria bacterium]